MKRCFLAILPMACLSGCAPKQDLPVVPDQAMAEASGVPLATLERGRSVYISQCGRCHEVMMPEDVSREDWHLVGPGMAWNAGIDEADEDAVMSYILAASE